MTGRQWVKSSSSQLYSKGQWRRPPPTPHHQTNKAEGKSTELASLINRCEYWSTWRPRWYSVSFCWQDFNSNGSHSHSTSDAHWRSHTLARISWNFFYFPDANFRIFLSEFLFHLPRGREHSRRENKYKSPEGGPSWAYWKNRKKASAAWTCCAKENCRRNWKGCYHRGPSKQVMIKTVDVVFSKMFPLPWWTNLM